MSIYVAGQIVIADWRDISPKEKRDNKCFICSINRHSRFRGNDALWIDSLIAEPVWRQTPRGARASPGIAKPMPTPDRPGGRLSPRKRGEVRPIARILVDAARNGGSRSPVFVS